MPEMSRIQVYVRTAAAFLGAGILCAAATSSAHQSKPASDAKAAALMTKPLTGIAGKEGLMLTVEYPPGGASPAHRHDAHVFVYVLEGSIVMGVQGREPVTLGAGETFYENPQDVHEVSKNASSTKPAKFLVFMVKDSGKPTSKPVEHDHD